MKTTKQLRTIPITFKVNKVEKEDLEKREQKTGKCKSVIIRELVFK